MDQGSSNKYYKPRGSKDKLIEAKIEGGTSEMLSSLVDAGECDDPNTLIDIKITNPLKKIYELLSEIKKKQNTTLSLKLTIPLIALPVFLFAAFQVGVAKGTCEQYETTKFGTVYSIDVEVQQEKSGLLNFLRIKPIETEHRLENKNILVDAQGNITTILNPKKVILDDYLGKSVFITGVYSSCTDVITLVSSQNISAGK